MDIYISRDGQQYGPYSLADIETDLNTGNILKTDLAWYEGASDWVPVSQLPGISKSHPSSSAQSSGGRWPQPAPPPKKTCGPLELILLLLLSLLIPPAGLIIGIMRLCRKRVEGWAMIAAALLVTFLSLSIPIANFHKARQLAQANACINNLRQIDGAIQLWALENKKPADAQVTLSDLSPYLKTTLVCPAGGTTFENSYSLTTVSQSPTCLKFPGQHCLPSDSPQAEAASPPTPAPTRTTPLPLPTFFTRDDSYKARRSYQAEIAQVLSDKAVNDISAIERRQTEVVEKILRHCGLWEEAPARDPPPVSEPVMG